MPTRLLLEGGDLPELLARVRAEHGARAKIVSAERVRAGVTGLPRAEYYELTIELADDDPADAAIALGAVAGPAPTTRPAMANHHAFPGAERPTNGGHPAAATSSGAGNFDEVLAELRGANASPGGNTAAPAPGAATNGGPGGMHRAGNGAAPGATHGPAGNGAAPGATHGPADNPRNGTAHRPATNAVNGARHGAAANREAAAAPGPPGRPGASPSEVVRVGVRPNGAAAGAATPSPDAASTSTPNMGPTGATRATTARTTAAPARPLSPDPRRGHVVSHGEPGTVPAESPLSRQLADLGMPRRVIERLPLGEAYPSIVRALLDEPVAPPLPAGPGTIVTIIGELAGALAAAGDLARILRLDAARALVASESPRVGRHMADPGDAARQAARLRGGDQPRLVCVDAPTPTGWVRQVVAALRPDAVWCAVDATRKPADVARQLRSLPRVDALAVHALDSTADPASPLALGVPVALLDGQPAGPHGWAALLCRRLFEEAPPGGDR